MGGSLYERQATRPFDNKLIFGGLRPEEAEMVLEVPRRAGHSVFTDGLREPRQISPTLGEKQLPEDQACLALLGTAIQAFGDRFPAAWNDLLIERCVQPSDREVVIRQISDPSYGTGEGQRLPSALARPWMGDDDVVPTGSAVTHEARNDITREDDPDLPAGR